MNNYLMALQVARESWGSFMTPIMYLISEFAFYIIPIIAILLYLCVDKKKYTSLVFCFIIGNYLMNFIKIVACIYRPWVSNPELHVAPIAEHSASGYSFPSGHTTAGTVFYGSMMVEEKKNKNRVWMQLLMIFMIIITGFSRNWLGAHTIKDVLSAIIIAVISIFLGIYIVKYVDNNPEKDIVILIGGLLLSAVSMVYFVLKSYPIDYGADGNIICDPIPMQKDSWLACGFMIAWLISWFIDRRIVKFSTDVPKKYLIIRGIIAALLFGSLYMVIMKKIGEHIPVLQLGYFLRGFVPVAICAGVFPVLFSKWESKHNINK